MFTSIFIILAVLFVKHWYIDFVNQTSEEVAGKGIYGQAHGVMHSIKHGVATAILMFMFMRDFEFVVILGLIDFVVHYHVDWAKMKINAWRGYTIEQPQFWALLGFDQLLHALTYIMLVWMIV